MSFFSYKKRRRVKSLALCAVMLLSVAAQSVLPTRLVLAVGETSQEDNYPEGDDINPKDNLEEYVVYRWSPVTSKNMPGANDDDWHLAMLFRMWNNNIEGPYFNGKVTERLYLGTNPKYTPQGYDRSNILTYNSSSPGWGKIEQNDVAESTTHYLKNKYVYGYNDSTVRPFDSFFYTADDRDCISVKRVSTSTYRKNSDGLGAYEYEIKFKSSDKDYEYFLWGNVDGDSDANFWALTANDSTALAKTMKDKNYNEDYKTTNRFCFINYGTVDKMTILKDPLYKFNGYGAMAAVNSLNGASSSGDKSDQNVTSKEAWNIVGEINGHDPWLWASGSGEQDNTWWYFRDKKTNDSRFIWYNGERLRYSAFRSSMSLTNHQVLSITESTYVSDEGEKDSQQGVILPNGKSITVNKGCVLSISGNFINNGTIIVNGGTLIIKDGGAVYPFLPGTDISKNGCGLIRCLGGDIIIEKGGALYAGLTDENGNIATFSLDNNATLINQGLLVYGSMSLGKNTRVELYEDSVTYGGYYQMVSQFETYQNITRDAFNTVSKNLSEQGYLRFHSASRQIHTANDKTATVYDAFFEKRTRLQPDDMLPYYSQSLLEGKPENCPVLIDCYKTLEDLNIQHLETITERYGMRPKSDSINIKVATSAKFNDGFAKNNPTIRSNTSTLTL